MAKMNHKNVKDTLPSPAQQVKKIIVQIILVMCMLVLLFGVLSVLDQANEKIEEELLEYISEYQQDETLILSGRNRLYFNNSVIETKGQFLYATKESLYQYYFDNKNDMITVKLTNLTSNVEAVVMEKKCEDFKKACMYDENIIYIVTEKEYYLYDIENDSYEPMSELATLEFISIKKYESEVKKSSFFKDHKEFTITRKEDNVSKTVSTKDILEVEQAKRLNEIYELGVSNVFFKGEEIFILCYSYNVVTVYKYDFDTEDIAFCSWCHMVDSESLYLYFLN